MNESRNRDVSDRQSRPIPERPFTRPPRPQFSLRAVLVFVTACCVLFAALAAAPGRSKISVIVLAALVPVLAYPASAIPRGFVWLVGGAAVGLAGGLLLGAALVAHAYGPADKDAARYGFALFSYTGPLAGGVIGLCLARLKRPVAIAGAIGGGVSVVDVALYLSVTRAELYASSAEVSLVLVAVVVILGTCAGVAVGGVWKGSPASLYWVMVLLLVTAGILLGSCCLLPMGR